MYEKFPFKVGDYWLFQSPYNAPDIVRLYVVSFITLELQPYVNTLYHYNNGRDLTYKGGEGMSLDIRLTKYRLFTKLTTSEALAFLHKHKHV